MTCRIDRLSTEQGLYSCASAVGSRRRTWRSFALRSTDDRVVAIELAEVELVDRDAVKLLAQAEAEGIELRNCPAYIREWITNERDEQLATQSNRRWVGRWDRMEAHSRTCRIT